MRSNERQLRQPSVAQASRAHTGARRQPDADSPATGRAGYFFAAFEAARDAMVILDDARRFVDANPAACQLHGVGSEQLVGRRIDDFTPPEIRKMLDDRWASFLLAGYEEGEHELLRDDGSRVA